MQNWTLFYSAHSISEASIIKGMLENNDVPVMMVNKQDSSYLNFGDIELYVPFHLNLLAKQLLGKALLN